MKNKLYYVMYAVYLIVVFAVMVFNGVLFSKGEPIDVTNLCLNGGFLFIIGILLLLSTAAFRRWNKATGELVRMTNQLVKEYKAAGGKSLAAEYLERPNPFQNEALKNAYGRYCLRMKSYRKRDRFVNTCDIEEFIHEDLLNHVGRDHFNSSLGATFTGLGILGTFLGLSIGLGSFNGNDIYAISDNVGTLLGGMKVAFHTSVYGIIFSLVFGFVYRSIMSDGYTKLEGFLQAFRQCASVELPGEDQQLAGMLVYQANIANSMKELLEYSRVENKEQMAQVEAITAMVMDRIQQSLEVNFTQYGSILKNTSDMQGLYANHCRDLIDATTAMIEIEKRNQERLEKMIDTQVMLSEQLANQGKMLGNTCKEITDEISSQLYTFGQMRKLYEKQE